MDISGHIQKGIAPLEITFSLVDSVAKFVKWLWTFGDGSSSTQSRPKHTYMAPGIYTVSLTLTDEYGNTYTFTKIDYIYVYGYPIGSEGLVSGHTDVCYRHSVKPSQGQGITPFNDKWVWPMVLCATAKGYTENHENLSLVINAEDMKIYRIGIPELWTDREGTYEEAEIPTESMLPEIMSRYGEHENVRHVETHALVRSWDEKNYRGKEGYTPEGLRNAQELSIEVFQSGEQIIPATKLRKVNNGGDYAFMKEVEARRIQLKLKTTTSAFRITRVAAHCQELDHRTPPQLNDIPEKQYQKEFSAPDLWFSRNKPTIYTNRGDLTIWTGAAVASTGPDNKTSAFNSAGVSGVLSYTAGDFTISGWLNGAGTLFTAQVAGGGVVTVEIVGTNLRFTDGINTAIVALYTLVGWVNVTVVRTGPNIELYENGRLKLVQPLTSVLAYGGATTIVIGMGFDIRRIPRAISGNAVYFYYESVIAGGEGFLP
jgi:PKD repeat protein